MIVLNTGPHWQKHVMATPNLGEAEFKAAFQQMVRKGGGGDPCVLARFTADQAARFYQFDVVSQKVRKLPVAAYWRTTAPAHIDCIDETERERLSGGISS